MKIFKLLILVCLPVFFFASASSQNSKENELVLIGGEKFILHQVRTGETIYSISRDFKIETGQLISNNPTISEGLSVGQILKVPFNENVDLSQFPKYSKGEPTGFENYIVETNGETPYSVARKNGVTVEEIYTWNPDIQRLKRGMVLKIPKWNLPVENQVQPESQKEPAQIVVNNKELVEHVVVSGETLYSLSKKYEFSESDIVFYNPEAKNLKAGSKIYLPAKSTISNLSEKKQATSVNTDFASHTIASGETLWSVSRKYNVSEDELKKINPELESGFKAGTVIKIPAGTGKGNNVQESIPENKIPAANENSSVNSAVPPVKVIKGCETNSKIFEGKTCKVALFLPLYIDTNVNLNKEYSNDSTEVLQQNSNVEVLNADTIIENEIPIKALRQFHGNSENFMQFYEGVLLAVDSMQRTGMKIKLNVFDSKENPEIITRILGAPSFEKPDIIIGPVYENVQKEIARYAAENQVPIISPFTPKSVIINSNPIFYQINPTREYIAEVTARMVAQNYAESNFIVVKTSNYEGTSDGQLVNLIQQRLAETGNGKGSFKVYDFKKERAKGLRDLLVTDKENVVFIPSSDEGELSVAISNINNLADEYSITLIGSTNYQQKYLTIEVAHFHNLKLQYINPYWVNYKNQQTIEYVEKFRNYFGTEPNSYGIQGFDVAFYFLNALQMYGTDFAPCLQNLPVSLVQGNYSFQKVSATGGYMNQGVSVISYNRNFEVESFQVLK